MGNKQTTFTAETFSSIKACTNFSRSKILTLFKRFRDLDPHRVPPTMLTPEALNTTVSQELLLKVPELVNNPFRDRILYIFSHDRINNPGDLSFLNFVELFNFLDEQTSKMQKLFYAFKIFDCDNDGAISGPDIVDCLSRITDNALTRQETTNVFKNVIREGEQDGDDQISFIEFESLLLRSQDFMNHFTIRL